MADAVRRKTRPSFNHQLTFATTHRRRGRRLLFLLVPLVTASLTLALSQELRPWLVPAVPPAAVETAPAVPEVAVAVEPVPPPVRKVEIEYLVRPKDSLGQIFTQLKLDVTELPAILSVPAVRDRFRAIQPDETLTFALENGVLRGIRRRLSETEVLAIERSGSGFTAEVTATPIEVRTAQVRGTVSPSLYAAGRAVGLSPELLHTLTHEIFAWDIDFARDVRPGDRFNVIYEQRYRAGEYLGDGRIVAAEYVNGGEIHRAVRYTSPDGKIDDYFTPEARSVRRPFLRTPLDSARAAPEPEAERPARLLSTVEKHEGIDYRAPAGTPVKATGDGRIRFLGANGEYGHTVIIDHSGSVSTLYAHLSGFARELQPSQPVKQGEIIGYVGYSGAATAPHLHYEYRVNGAYADPRAAEVPAGAPLPAEYRTDFQSKAAALLAELEQRGDAVITAALAR